MTTIDKTALQSYHDELQAELEEILKFWSTQTIDHRQGGFIGRMNNKGIVDDNAPKGLVLNARILWTFSAAYAKTPDPTYLAVAQRAFGVLSDHFYDEQFAGYYWSVRADGTALNTRKQVYGQAFVLYALAEYHRILHDKNERIIVWAKAVMVFGWIEQYSFDRKNSGYWEAVAQDGSPLDDLRLSERDRNDPKTMNTHLHILEAYANLYRIWPDKNLKTQLNNLIDLFLDKIIDPKTHHLICFFDAEWNPSASPVSYGHDIETAWLLLEAAEIVQYRVEEARIAALQIAQAATEGFDPKLGALYYEDHLPEKHWWVEAEAMVGFLNAWEITQEEHWLGKSLACWAYIKQKIKDKKHGEWFWGIDAQGKVMEGEDKVGFWKCPYHNTRACLEIIQRLDKHLMATN
ncbi:AGE family epimerase/isomerase [Haliscomenobacter hydrossis]|uniref:Cellobiose 2-epimerase n=1 Tax=Haliscomenobacter hydrossis (strain ATCC 27775 / DSM 1100 / LMG 10767 / O) TaxID=760192 RepID=F4KTJ1_HALH1|nr:AGE family epimerase/isomerase [Haliscomenobacter hydrossis]AEE53365.1 N-acylglucosamine 2-epimerase [Haliscomenobacter hydrossis DSM 1100]